MPNHFVLIGMLPDEKARLPSLARLNVIELNDMALNMNALGTGIVPELNLRCLIGESRRSTSRKSGDPHVGWPDLKKLFAAGFSEGYF